MSNQKIIDAFIFFNEYDLLEARLEYLYDFVDCFVIVEADLTFSGKEKEFNYLKNIIRFEKYQDKILYLPIHIDRNNYDFENQKIVIKQTDYTQPAWKVENYQRDCIYKALKMFNKDDIVIFGDVDEIPNREYIKFLSDFLKRTDIFVFHQLFFYYNFDRVHEDLWIGTFVTTNKFLLQSLESKISLSDLRGLVHRPEIPKLGNGGWHLSYWMSLENIQKKIASFSHQEYNVEKYTNIENLKKAIIEGTDLFDRPNEKYINFDINLLPEDFYDIFKKTIIKIETTIEHYAHNIEGWFSSEDFKFYKSAYDAMPDSAVIVEVGSWKGRSSSFMAVEIANGNKNIRFHCVDTWRGGIETQLVSEEEQKTLYETFKKNMEPVKDYYVPIVSLSVDAANYFEDNSIDMVFIDAAHDYESVKEDILAWLPKVKEGGMVSGHDVQSKEVQTAVIECFGGAYTIGSCWYIKKERKNG